MDKSNCTETTKDSISFSNGDSNLVQEEIYNILSKEYVIPDFNDDRDQIVALTRHSSSSSPNVL